MKKQLGSTCLLLAALASLSWYAYTTPPGGAPWHVFVEEPATLRQKLAYFQRTYLWPACLSFFAIALLQLQFRLASSGANKRTIFAGCVFGSGCMFLSLRALSLSPSSGPAYVAGMALGYTVMAQLYAVRMRTLWGRVRVPWPVWRGNARAVGEVDAAVRRRMGAPARGSGALS